VYRQTVRQSFAVYGWFSKQCQKLNDFSPVRRRNATNRAVTRRIKTSESNARVHPDFVSRYGC
jgi:hypothetical protein